MTQGIVIGVIGLAVLLVMVMVRRRMDGKPAIVFNGKAIAITLFGIVATVVFGVGMCMTMVWNMMVGCELFHFQKFPILLPPASWD